MIDLPCYTYPLVTDDNKTNKVKAKTKTKRKKRQPDIFKQVLLNYERYCKLHPADLQRVINKLTPPQQLIFKRSWDEITLSYRYSRLLHSLNESHTKH